MAWNRCGYPTPPDDGQDHRKCPVCGWIPCLPECRMAINYWTVEQGLADLQDMDPPQDAQDFVDDGDFE